MTQGGWTVVTLCWLERPSLILAIAKITSTTWFPLSSCWWSSPWSTSGMISFTWSRRSYKKNTTHDDNLTGPSTNGSSCYGYATFLRVQFFCKSSPTIIENKLHMIQMFQPWLACTAQQRLCYNHSQVSQGLLCAVPHLGGHHHHQVRPSDAWPKPATLVVMLTSRSCTFIYCRFVFQHFCGLRPGSFLCWVLGG